MRVFLFLMPAVIFLSIFFTYLSGLCGTIPAYRDAGDLIASVSTLGIAHPPGYPSYVLLGHLFSRLCPWGNAAYRVNLFSAGCASAAAVFLFLTLRNYLRDRGTGGTLIALLLTIAYALTPAVLALAHVAEMYSPSVLVAAAILFLLSLPKAQPVVASFLLALGLGVHPTLLFLLPLFIPILKKQSLNEKGMMGLFFVLGTSMLLFLPLRAAAHPLQNWGDPSHWRTFWRVLTRADYGGLKLHPEQSELHWTLQSLVDQTIFWGRLMKEQWTSVGFALSGLGWAAGLVICRDSRKWMVLLCHLLMGPLFVIVANLPIHETTSPAILQPYLVLGNLVWVAGLTALYCEISARRAFSFGMGAMIVGAAMIEPRLATASLRHDFYAYDYGRNLMRSLPEGSLLYDPDDPTAFTLRALQVNEHRRTDLILLNFFRTRWGYEQLVVHYPDLLPPVPIDNAAELERMLWSYSIQRHPFYAELPQKLGKIPYHSRGLVYAVEISTDSPAAEHLQQAKNLLALYPARGDLKTVDHEDFFTSHLIGYYAAAHNNFAMELASHHQWDEAVTFYKSALAIDPQLSAAYNNWGIAAYEQGNYPLAEALYRKALKLEPTSNGYRDNLQLVLMTENHKNPRGK
jgi:tetratricopeptide (TPR) repeat protein